MNYNNFMNNLYKNLLHGLSLILYYLGVYICYQYGARFQSFLILWIFLFPILLILMMIFLPKSKTKDVIWYKDFFFYKKIPLILLITHILTMIVTYMICTMLPSGPM
jgi:hypothetical protein